MNVKAEGKIWKAIGMIEATIEVGDITEPESTTLADAVKILYDAIEAEDDKNA